MSCNIFLITDAQSLLLDLLRDENTALRQYNDEVIESEEQVIKTVVSLLVNPDTFKVCCISENHLVLMELLVFYGVLRNLYYSVT